MKIELKNIKYSDFASQETHCFEATVYIDGKRSFIASNEGRGGPTDFHPLKGDDYKSLHEKLKIVEQACRDKGPIEFQWVKANGETVASELDNTLEMELGHLMNRWLLEREAKKITRRISYFNHEDNEIYQLPAARKPTPQNLMLVRQAKWWDPSNYTLLNGLPVTEVVDYLER